MPSRVRTVDQSPREEKLCLRIRVNREIEESLFRFFGVCESMNFSIQRRFCGAKYGEIGFQIVQSRILIGEIRVCQTETPKLPVSAVVSIEPECFRRS